MDGQESRDALDILDRSGGPGPLESLRLRLRRSRPYPQGRRYLIDSRSLCSWNSATARG